MPIDAYICRSMHSLSLSQTHLFSLIENKCQREFLSHLAAAARRCEQIKMHVLCASNVQFSPLIPTEANAIDSNFKCLELIREYHNNNDCIFDVEVYIPRV